MNCSHRGYEQIKKMTEVFITQVLYFVDTESST
jgi:hypothetical protein